jgi:hypothetical protein
MMNIITACFVDSVPWSSIFLGLQLGFCCDSLNVK